MIRSGILTHFINNKIYAQQKKNNAYRMPSVILYCKYCKKTLLRKHIHKNVTVVSRHTKRKANHYFNL